MADFSFIHPQWFFAALPLALLLPWVKNKAEKAGLIAPHLATLLFITDANKQKKSGRPLFALALGWFLSVVALAGPSWQQQEIPAVNLAGARVLVMDMSRSMYATDIPPNRLTQARFKALDMLPGWKEGSTGLVTYAADGYIVSPLTQDSETLKTLIPKLSPQIMPLPGSNAAAGIQQAIDLLKQAGFNEGDIVLITDGMSPQESKASLLTLDGTPYRVSILAIGTEVGAPIQLPDGRLLEKNGEAVIAKMTLTTLSAVTQKTGGILQMWQPTNTDVENIIAFTSSLQSAKPQEKEKMIEEKINGGFWLILPVMLLALLSFRRGVVLAAFFVLMPIQELKAAPFKTEDQTAYKQFQSGEFQQAAETFSSPSWKGIAQYKAGDFQGAIDTLSQLEDNTSRYNLGNAYAQAGQLEEAIKTYDALLEKDPKHTDARHNLDILKKAKDEQDKQKEKNKDNKEENNEQDKKDEQDKQDEQSQEGKENKEDQGQPKDNNTQEGSKDKNNKSNEGQENKENKPQGSKGDDPQKDKEGKGEEKEEDAATKPSKSDEDEKEGSDKAGSDKTGSQAEKEGAGKDDKEENAPGKKGEEKGTGGLSPSHPILKKLEQIEDDTQDLIRAQLYLQAQQKDKPKKTENAW